MSKSLLTLSVALIVAAAASAGLTATDLPKVESVPHKVDPQKASFSTDQTVWLGFVEDRKHEQDFADAMEQFVQNRPQAAAKEISRIEAFLRIEEGRASGEGVELIRNARERLRSLHDSLKMSSAGNIEIARLQSTFALVDWELASHHLILAKQDLADQQRALAGYDLGMSISNLISARQWSGMHFEVGQTDDLEQAAAVAKELNAGGNYDPTEVVDAFDTVDQLLQLVAGAKSWSDPTPRRITEHD